jgi:hypothetical protein
MLSAGVCAVEAPMERTATLHGLAASNDLPICGNYDLSPEFLEA